MLKLILWIVVALLVLSFFGISLRALAGMPATQDNFSYVWQLVLNGWNSLVLLVQQFVNLFVGILNNGMSLHF